MLLNSTAGSVSDKLLLNITGVKWTDNSNRNFNGISAKCFQCSRLHRLTRLPAFQCSQVNVGEFIECWYQKIPRYVCLLQSAGSISTSRITTFLEFMLKHLCAIFGKNGTEKFCQDRPQYIGDLVNRKDRLIKNLRNEKSVFYIVAADVTALYPASLCSYTVTKALEYALVKGYIFNTKGPQNRCWTAHWSTFLLATLSHNMATS